MTGEQRAATGEDPRPPPPDIQRALEWRDWETGLREASESQRPILCLAEAPWTNGAQRLALVLGQDAALREAAAAFVPVLLDPYARPDLAARLRLAALRLEGSAGPPLVCLLTDEGFPFLSYCTMWPEGKGDYPSLTSLLRSSAESYAPGRAELLAEARRLQEATRSGAPASAAWESELDECFGGLSGLPKLPPAPLLWGRLAQPDDEAFLLATLDGMRRGGLCDQLSGSFHRAARDVRWVVPHFEKTAPQNAALAAVYTRAARRFGREDFAETARCAAAFTLACLERGADATASDPDHYTWTSSAVHEALPPALVQVVGLHVQLTPDPSPHVLYRALEPEEMDVGEALGTVRERLAAGKAQLALLRDRRRPPARVRLPGLHWRAESVRWLLLAHGEGLELPLGALLGWLEGLEPDARGWLGERAALCLAWLAAHRLTKEAAHRKAALAQADALLVDYLDPSSGALRDRPGASDSQDVVDCEVTSAVGAALGALVGLTPVSERCAQAAHAVAAHHAPSARLVGLRASAFWQARSAR